MIFELKLFITDLFFAFSIFTLLFFNLSIFIKTKILKNIDEEVLDFIAFSGIVFLVLFAAEIFMNLTNPDQDGRLSFRDLIFGKYWPTFWIEPLVWVLMTQLLRLEKIRKNVFLRLIFSFVFIITIENLISFYSVFNHDYLPSSWSMKSSLFFYPSNIFLEILMKVFLLLFLAKIFHSINLKIKDWKTSKIKSQ
jgi:hypothetical protein